MKKRPIPEPAMRDNLASNLRYLRKASRGSLSQEALARILHISRKTIINYESGNVSPAAYTVYLIARYSGYTMEELLSKRLCQKKEDTIE